MRIPRDLSGDGLIKRLNQFGYEAIRQSGSHVRLAVRKALPPLPTIAHIEEAPHQSGDAERRSRHSGAERQNEHDPRATQSAGTSLTIHLSDFPIRFMIPSV